MSLCVKKSVCFYSEITRMDTSSLDEVIKKPLK